MLLFLLAIKVGQLQNKGFQGDTNIAILYSICWVLFSDWYKRNENNIFWIQPYIINKLWIMNKVRCRRHFMWIKAIATSKRNQLFSHNFSWYKFLSNNIYMYNKMLCSDWIEMRSINQTKSLPDTILLSAKKAAFHRCLKLRAFYPMTRFPDTRCTVTHLCSLLSSIITLRIRLY